MKIAQVSKRYGLSTDTLRYYERIGLLGHVPRSESGIRDYSEENCKTIEFIKYLRDGEVSIDDIAAYMKAYHNGEVTDQERKQMLIQQRNNIRQRISDLNTSLEKIDCIIMNFDEVKFQSDETK